MTKIVASARYLIIIPIIGLALAAAVFFLFAGFGLIQFLFEGILEFLGLAAAEAPGVEVIPLEVEILEFVHKFMIGTVLYITAVGFYQLFIKEIKLPGWLHIDSNEDLETNLVGVIVVVLAINFMGLAFTKDADVLLRYGAAFALPIAALALFIGLRSWSASLARKSGDAGPAAKDSLIAKIPPAAEQGEALATAAES